MMYKGVRGVRRRLKEQIAINQMIYLLGPVWQSAIVIL
jgi:hypothetical protein